jgi:glycosyltransferase involved in cell wall biosynthesis
MILLISSVFPPEPVVSASITHDLATALSMNREVRVITPKPSRPFGYTFINNQVNNENFEQTILNSFTCPQSSIFGRMRESYSFGKHAVNYIIKNKTQIECIYINAWPLLAQYLIVKAAKKYSIPSIIQVDDIYPESLTDKIPFFGGIIRRILLPMDRYILQNVSKIVVISEKMQDTFVQSRGISEDRIEIVQNWQNEERFFIYKNSKKKENRNEIFTYMFLGNLNITAAVNIIISAFKKSEIKNSRLVIAGNGAEKDNLISLVKSYNVLNIEFWDAPMTEVPAIQDKADVLILNLKRNAAKYSLPSKLPAYMFSEKPIIACVDEESGIADIIKHANCGWVVSPESIDALAKTMQAVVSFSVDDLHSLGRNGFNYALKHLSKKSNLQKLTKIVNETLRS